MFKVKFADIGEGLTEGKVTEVMVNLGDTVKAGDSLFHVETDKVNSEIPAPVAGKIAKINIKADQEIKVGEVVMEIDDGTGTAVETPAEQPTKKVEAKKEVEEENASVVGSTLVSNEVIASRDTTSNTVANTNKGVKASPLARKIAADKGIDLTTVTPSGPNGRILVADLDNAKAGSTSKVSRTLVDRNQPLSWKAVPMNGVRKATVKAMVKSVSENAAFTGMKDIDITSTFDTRAQLKDYATKNDIKLTYLAFIVKATAKALEEMPNVNVRIDAANNQILQIDNINIAIAVDTADGLMVPVIKGANHLSVFELANEINDLANKAKNKKLSMAEMKDATFTVSNFGSVGLDYATPIINSPESAILGVGGMKKVPTYVGNDVVGRYIMPFSMTCDHRIIDGADAGRFLMRIEHYMQNPSLLLID